MAARCIIGSSGNDALVDLALSPNSPQWVREGVLHALLGRMAVPCILKLVKVFRSYSDLDSEFLEILEQLEVHFQPSLPVEK